MFVCMYVCINVGVYKYSKFIFCIWSRQYIILYVPVLLAQCQLCPLECSGGPADVCGGGGGFEGGGGATLHLGFCSHLYIPGTIFFIPVKNLIQDCAFFYERLFNSY